MTTLRIADDGSLGGENKVAEADETYIGGKARNRKGKIAPKTPVLSLVEREAQVRSFHINVPNTGIKECRSTPKGVGRYPPGGTGDASREAVDQMVVPKAA